MNREKMIEAITTAILGKTAPKAAASVLDLCGPEKLVWQSSSDDYLPDNTGEWGITIWRSRATGKPIEFEFEGEVYTTLEAAQAAAQSLATAAHWAPTPLGQALGLEEDFPTKNQTQAPIRIKLRS